MATVNKNFRIKNGLVVEGLTATVNGEDILTKSSADQSYIVNLIGGTATSSNTADTVVKRDGSGNFAAGTITANLTGDVTGTVSSISNHDSDDLSEGSLNLYFTDARARSAISGGTGIDYNSSTGLISVDNTIATTNYADNAVTTAINALDSDDIEEGSANLYFTNQRALDATSAAYDAAGSALSAQSAAESFATSAINALDSDDIEEGASNLYFTNQRALDATSAAYDAAGAASSAEANANSYTDTAINNLDSDDVEEGISNLYFTDSRARGAVSAGSGLTYNSGTGEFAVDTNSIATQSYVDTAVSNLVDGAPGLLDTLNELAAAINDDASFATTITTGLAGKLSLTGGTMTGAITLASDPANALEAATKQYVDAAESAAQAAAEATADAALDAVLDGTTDFTALDVNSVSRQIAATTGNVVTAAATTAIEWAKADYRSAKILVKAKNGSHTHISEVIVTLDTSDNIALNEYAVTTTNGSLMTIDADISGSNVRLRVTPAHNNTEVMAHATLLA